jgi:magnesium-transporting ATPase (P-type)
MATYSIINIIIIVSILAAMLMTLSAILYNRSQVALDFIGQPAGLCNECSHLAQAMLLKARLFAIAGAVLGAASAAIWFGRERLSIGKILEGSAWLRLLFPDYSWTGFALHIPFLQALTSFLRLMHLSLPKLRLPSRLSF